MNNSFVTISAPTTILAANQHAMHSNQKTNATASMPQKKLAPWQAGYYASTTHEEEEMVNDPKALRSQAPPKIRISLRRRVTDALNSPFEYEMTEAARVVL
eukprot:scaffold12481_cov87-Cylindrotheca_fusiformis.AAC.1